ncbi:hypothetical protein [Paracoccus sp. IB05]|uniref:hypothetical protein n=1 Tax=Paracoccus sp. IB05 TaxID=2779367 RepID=UPI0018E888BF|nr:hypothetical protein [Paracoccus sp. IB05]MBJ2153656.1 hypothetical protein [Paracoccus sp. IB05]
MFKPFRAFSGAGKAVAGGPDPETFTPSHLFAAGPAGHWQGGHDPAAGRLSLDSAGTVPAILPDQPVGLVRRLVGSVNASQATALSRPTLARWPKGGRRNVVPASGVGAAPGLIGSGQPGALPTGWTSSAGREVIAVEDDISVIRFSGTTTGAFFINLHGNTSVAASDGQAWVSSFDCELLDARNVQQLAIQQSSRVAGGGNKSGGMVTPLPSSGRSRVITGPETFLDSQGPVGSGPVAHILTYLRFTAATADWSFTIRAGKVQIEKAPLVSPYQHVAAANDVTETGNPEVWYLWSDGGDSLDATPVPAGTYGLAWVDVLGEMTVSSVTSDGTTPVDLLRAERQADVILRQGTFTSAEEAQIRSYWAGRYAA